MVTERVPSQMAENEADRAGKTERQAAYDGTEETEDAVEDAAAERAPRRNVHTANSMGRLLSFAAHDHCA